MALFGNYRRVLERVEGKEMFVSELAVSLVLRGEEVGFFKQCLQNSVRKGLFSF